jgi:hypothetical protein
MHKRVGALQANLEMLGIGEIGAIDLAPVSHQQHDELLRILPKNNTAPGTRIVDGKETKMKVCKYGLMLYPAREAVGQSLDHWGEWDEEAVDIFRALLGSDPVPTRPVVVDVGAHIGSYSLFFAKAVAPAGSV